MLLAGSRWLSHWVVWSQLQADWWHRIGEHLRGAVYPHLPSGAAGIEFTVMMATEWVALAAPRRGGRMVAGESAQNQRMSGKWMELSTKQPNLLKYNGVAIQKERRCTAFRTTKQGNIVSLFFHLERWLSRDLFQIEGTCYLWLKYNDFVDIYLLFKVHLTTLDYKLLLGKASSIFLGMLTPSAGDAFLI